MKRLLAVLPLALALLFSALPARAYNMPGGSALPGQLLDLNSATEAQLKELPGIGEARAKGIVKCREEKPLKGKDELFERCGVPKAVYEKLKHLVIARQGKQ